MDAWIWIGIAVVVIVIAWLSLRKKKNKSYGTPVRSEGGGFWGAVKDACCIRNR